MTRVDELYEMRRAIDVEIERELEALRTMAELRDGVLTVLSTTRTSTTRIMLAVTAAYGVPVDDILGASRNRQVTRARHVAAWLLHDSGMSYSDVGRTLTRDHSTAMHSVARVLETPDLFEGARRIRAAMNRPVAVPDREVS